MSQEDMNQENENQESNEPIHFDKVLDASGLNCPMPVVKARKEVRSLEPGQTLKVLSTDRGSIKDFQGWAKVDKKVDLVGQQTDDEGDSAIYLHFVQLVN